MSDPYDLCVQHEGRVLVPSVSIRHHIGLPEDEPPDRETQALVDEVAGWFQMQARPWCVTRRQPVLSIERARVELEGGNTLESLALAATLKREPANEVVLFAASAGAEVEARTAEHWRDDRPDLAGFLDAWASAVVETLRESCRAELAEDLAPERRVSVHLSPGYAGWDLRDQENLFRALVRGDALPGPFAVLESGGLTPAKSTLGAFALAPGGSLSERLDAADEAVTGEPGRRRLPERALAKWADQRLEWNDTPGGRVARFRFEGTTCASLGLPLAYLYELAFRLKDAENPTITDASVRPLEGDIGHRGQCSWLADPDGFRELAAEPPGFIGETLTEALQHAPGGESSGCLCTRSHRAHKWRIVLETTDWDLKRRQR